MKQIVEIQFKSAQSRAFECESLLARPVHIDNGFVRINEIEFLSKSDVRRRSHFFPSDSVKEILIYPLLK